MHVNVNDSCIACGACESVCPEVFHVEDKAIPDNSHVAGHEDCTHVAAESCPVNAIEIEE